MDVTVWIPTEASLAAAMLAPGSAVVSEHPTGAYRTQCWFEGNLYGAQNMLRFADRADQATSRMRTSYPTVATAAFRTAELVAVGTYDPETGDVILDGPEARALLGAWLGIDDGLLDDEQHSTSIRHQGLRELRDLESRDPQLARWMRHHGPSPYRDRP